MPKKIESVPGERPVRFVLVRWAEYSKTEKAIAAMSVAPARTG
ncbi:hypothetical protein [Nocardioides sp. NPDC006273]